MWLAVEKLVAGIRAGRKKVDPVELALVIAFVVLGSTVLWGEAGFCWR